MTMLDRFSPSARHSLVRAAALARRAGRPDLGTDAMLLALAEGSGIRSVLGRHGASEPAVRDVVARRWGWDAPLDDRRLLALLGIDLDQVRRRRPTGQDETAGWRLDRSRLRPLRVSLAGPPGAMVLTGPARKVVEVALWRGRQQGTPAQDADLLHGLLSDPASRSVQVLCTLRVCFPSLIDELDARNLAA
jgi:hypothetical protein